MGFSPETITRLKEPLDRERIRFLEKSRGVPDPDKPFLPGPDVIDYANFLFGFDGWSMEVKEVHVMEPVLITKGGGQDEHGNPVATKRNWMVFAYASVRVTTAEGNFHEDAGCDESEQGEAKGPNVKTAVTGAVTNAMKRAFAHWGNLFGNSLKDPADRLGIAWYQKTGGEPMTPPPLMSQPETASAAPVMSPSSDMQPSAAPIPSQPIAQDFWASKTREQIQQAINQIASEIANGPTGTGQPPEAMKAAGILTPPALFEKDETKLPTSKLIEMGRNIEKELVAHRARITGR